MDLTCRKWKKQHDTIFFTNQTRNNTWNEIRTSLALYQVSILQLNHLHKCMLLNRSSRPAIKAELVYVKKCFFVSFTQWFVLLLFSLVPVHSKTLQPQVVWLWSDLNLMQRLRNRTRSMSGLHSKSNVRWSGAASAEALCNRTTVFYNPSSH